MEGLEYYPGFQKCTDYKKELIYVPLVTIPLMKIRDLIIIVIVFTGCLLSAACTQVPPNGGPTDTPVTTTTPVTAMQSMAVQGIPAETVTKEDLIAFVSSAREYARENGREKALATFNDPDGRFVKNGLYIFSDDYNGTALAVPLEPGLVGTNILDMKDTFGVPLVRNLGQTGRYGMGYVSSQYPNPVRNYTVEPKFSVVADVDGTYYVGVGMFEISVLEFPPVITGPAATSHTKDELVAFTKSAVDYAKKNGKEKALAAFNDSNGEFVQGEMAITAFDYNGTDLAGPPSSPERSKYCLNLLNYHDPDGVSTIREMRTLAKHGGGISYTVTRVSAGGKDIFLPVINYVKPVDDTWWLYSGITNPDYVQLRSGNLTGIRVRNHTSEELYTLVNRAVEYAKVYGKDNTLAEINNPKGQFVNNDLFAWAETFDGTILADPYWKAAIGNNYMNYTDPYGEKTTVTAINTQKEGTGFTHAMFWDTETNGTVPIPKLVYMKPVDDTWWIGSGIYGVRVG